MPRVRTPASFAACLAALLAAGPSSGQAPAPPSQPAAEEVLLLRAAHLFDGRSGKLESPGLLLVRGRKIVAVGTGTAPPPGARVIELGDATLVPGYIDAHTHIAGDHEDDWAKGFYEGMLRLPVEQSFHAARNAAVTLEAGVTTVREVGAADFIDVALRNAIEQGLVKGPRIVAAAHAIGSTGGHCDSSPFPPGSVKAAGVQEGVCNGADECRHAVREQMKFGADVIKICASGGVLSESDPVDVPQLTPDELSAIVGEAHAWGRKVAAHSHGDLAARQAVLAGVDSIEHGSFLTPATLALMKQKGAYLVPTRTALLWVVDKAATYPKRVGDKARAAGAGHETAMRAAFRLGVPIAMGTDAGVFPHGLNAREFGNMVDLGLTPAQALMTSSIGSARLLGVDGETGTLEVGKYADVVAVPGDVLQDVRATERPLLVMKQGVVVRGP